MHHVKVKNTDAHEILKLPNSMVTSCVCSIVDDGQKLNDKSDAQDVKLP